MSDSVTPARSTLLRVLGPIEVERDGRIIDLGGARQRRVLAALAVDAPAEVSKEALIERVWSDSERPRNPLSAVRSYVSRLRLAIDGPAAASPAIVTTEVGYRLDTTLLETDVARLEVAAQQARELAPEAALEAVELALDDCRGAPLGQFADEVWALPEVSRLERLQLAVRELRLDLMVRTGVSPEQIVADASVLIEAHPLHDGPRGVLMTALYRGGRAADALRAFDTYRRKLNTDLGLEPGPELQELERRILANDSALFAEPLPRQLGAYDLIEQIGEGSFSTVWRGRQSALGRDVAIKEIRSALVNEGDFVRRFEAEAHLIARFEHPHVVPLFDYWRQPDAAFLVMRWLRGGSLQQRLRSRPLDVTEASRLVQQVGAALEAAHRIGIVHRDVKPANILLDTETNFYVGDFGIATTVDADHAASSIGSPRYAAPEQLAGQAPTPAVDVFGLAATVYEALGGRVGSGPGLERRRLADADPALAVVDALLDRALDPDPDLRIASVEQFRHEFVAGVDGEASGRRSLVEHAQPPSNPFRGLAAFEEADADVFFGRAAVVDEIVEHLGRAHPEPRFALLIGASGAGKSSVVRAGVIPAIRQGALGRPAPVVTVMRPGADPYAQLEAALRTVAVRSAPAMGRMLRASASGLEGVVESIFDDADWRLVLVIDQFEELWESGDEVQTQTFLDALARTATHPSGRVSIVATLRADYFDRPLREVGFGEIAAVGAVQLPSMAPHQFEEVITGPLAIAGVHMEDGLLTRMTSDVVGHPFAMPALQYCLAAMFDRRDQNDMLTNRAYETLGGVAGVLAGRAEEIYGNLDDDDRLAARDVFGALARLDGTAAVARKRVTLSTVASSEGHRRVLDAFGRSRLLVFDYDPTTRHPTVEVAHEALLSEWARFAEWIEGDRYLLQMRSSVSAAAEQWQSGGHETADLYRGARLQAAIDWAAKDAGGLGSVGEAFLDASLDAQHAGEVAERRRVRRLRRLLLTTAIGFVLALVAGVAAMVQQSRTNAALDRATNAESEAQTRRLIADAGPVTEANRETGLLLAAEAYRRDPGPATLGALQRSLTRTGPFLGVLGAGRDYERVAWSSDGDVIVALGSHGVDAIELATGALTGLSTSVPAPALAISPDGATVAVASGTTGGVILDITSGSELQQFSSTAQVRDLTFLPDGDLVGGDRAGHLYRWDPATGEQHDRNTAAVPPELADEVEFPEDLRHEAAFVPEGIERIAGTPLGDRIVVTGATVIRVFDAADLSRLLQHVPLTRAPITGGDRTPARPGDLAVSDDGRTVHVAVGQSIQAVDLETGALVREWRPGPTGSVQDRFSIAGAGDVIVSSLLSGELATWDESSGEQRLPTVATHAVSTAAGNADVAVSPDERTVAVAGLGGVRLFSIVGETLISESVARPGRWGRFAQVSPDGRLVVYSAFDRAPVFIDLTQPDAEPVTPGVANAAMGTVVAFGGPIVWEAVPQALQGWIIDPKTLEPTGQHVAPPLSVWSGDMTSDGALLALGSQLPAPASVRVVDTDSGEVLHTVAAADPAAPAGVAGLAWSPDASRLAAIVEHDLDEPGRSGLLQVYDTETWALVVPPIADGGMTKVAFSPDGRYLVTANFGGEIRVRDAVTLQPIGVELSVGTIGIRGEFSGGLEFTADGRYLVSTVDEPRIIDVATWSVIGDPFETENGFALGVPDGARFVPTVDGDVVHIWRLDPDTWYDLACAAAGRNMTTEEWEQYGADTAAPPKTCPQWP